MLNLKKKLSCVLWPFFCLHYVIWLFNCYIFLFLYHFPHIDTIFQVHLPLLVFINPVEWLVVHSSFDPTPRTHFTNALWVHKWNLVKIIFNCFMILMIQSDCNFAHVTTAQLSWHVQNCDLIWSLFFKSEQQKFSRELGNDLNNNC